MIELISCYRICGTTWRTLISKALKQQNWKYVK